MSDLPKIILSFLIVLGPLVILHELGHFWFAKRAGIRVLEFGLGFPPRARSLWRGMGRLRIGSTWVHTKRNFKFPSGLADGQIVQAQAVEEKGRLMLKSIQIIDAEREGAVTTPLRQAGLEGERLRGEVSHFDPGTIYSLNWLPIGGFVRMLGEEDPSAPDSFAAAPKRWRVAVLLAGPGMNLVAAFLIFVAAFMLGQLVADDITVLIDEVAANSPAQQAGLASGLEVLAIDGQPIDSTDALIDYTRQHLGETVTLTVRDAKSAARDVQVYARTADERPADQGPLGITIGGRADSYTIIYRSLPDALSRAFDAMRLAVDNMVSLPALLLSGRIEPNQARPVGPAGIAQLTSFALDESIDQGVLFPLLQLAGVISIALAVTNLLPLPALDGGRLVFVIIEAIRGKRIAPEKEAIVHFAGMMILLMLAVLITIQDVINPLPNPF
jgi:regulator of sigma E protease